MTASTAMRVVAGLLVIAACADEPPPREVVAAAPSMAIPAGRRPIAPAPPASSAPVVQLTAAATHACALHADGTVSCWGGNTRGELGPRPGPPLSAREGFVVAQPTPSAVPLDGVRAIATGLEGTCARRADGVWCWGVGSAVPERIGGVTEAVAFSPGCAVGATGEAWCWGDLLAADRTDALDDAIQLVAYGARTCGLRAAGEVVCRTAAADPEASRIELVIAPDAVEVALGEDQLCVRHRAGTVACAQRVPYDDLWGALSPMVGVDHALQIVAGDRFGCAREPTRIRCWGELPAPGTGVIELAADELAAGHDFACARTGGDVACWGQNAEGQLGTGWSTVHPAPIAVPGIDDAVDVHVGARSTCARRRNAQVSCWGQRGEPIAKPLVLAGADGAVQLAGSLDLCTRTAAGTVRCDRREGGDHGAGRFAARVVDLARMYGGAVAVTAEGRAVAWDSNFAVDAVGEAVGVETGNYTACFIRPDRRVVCVGKRLGPAAEQPLHDERRPHVVDGLERVADLAIGDAAACALLDDGTVRCWGDNAWGELARAEVAASSRAVPVFGLGTVVQISGSFLATCARIDDGTVRCWGRNATGVLGVDPAALPSSAVPVAIPIPRVVDLSVGQHACAVTASGAVWCWGLADKGQIGTWVSERSAAPVPVAFPR